METNRLILGKNQYFNLDSHESKVNNNVLIVGTSCAEKTQSFVEPNLLQAIGSYIVSDPKCVLYNKYKNYFEKIGYTVKKLDFTEPENSDSYNFFDYIRNTQDVVKVAHMIVKQNGVFNYRDLFWDEAAQLLLQSIISYIIEEIDKEQQNFGHISKLMDLAYINGNMENSLSKLDVLMRNLEMKNENSYAAKTYKKFRVAANRTLRSIMISLNAKIDLYDTPKIQKMLEKDDIDISSIGKTKTIIFVGVSDTDRSLDGLVNVFLTQAMYELCRIADKECDNGQLAVPVRFILDNFATHCKIFDFPRMISSIKSRGISAMLMIQTESQLLAGYGADDKTIIGNCDTYAYIGGNDIGTVKSVAERSNMPVRKILNMKVGTNWLFRRGMEPMNGENFELETFKEECFARVGI